MNDSLLIFGDMNIDQQYRDNINNSLNNPGRNDYFEKCLKTVLENAYRRLIALMQRNNHGHLFHQKARELSLTVDSKKKELALTYHSNHQDKTKKVIPGVTEPSQPNQHHPRLVLHRYQQGKQKESKSSSSGNNIFSPSHKKPITELV